MNTDSSRPVALPTAPRARWRIGRPARGAVDNARAGTMLNTQATM
jgi:hypothetical protein